MILQALNDYYCRKMVDSDPRGRLPAFGLEHKEIPFIIELAEGGKFLGIKDTRHIEGKKKLAARFLVPKGVKKTSAVAANLLWDTAEYVLGVDTKGKPERVVQQARAFRARIAALSESVRRDAGIEAVLSFLDAKPLAILQDNEYWGEIEEINPVISFRLANDTDLVCQRPVVVEHLVEFDTEESDDGAERICLVTGEIAQSERLHSAIKGVWGAQTSGANIVSFNLDAFASFGKEQGGNAPISRVAAFGYTTALNHLLAKGSRQRLQVGDASAVFWAQKADEVEDVFGELFAEGDDPDARTERIRALFEAIHAGRFDGARGQNRFFVLGLSPNAARISVRFWHVARLIEIARQIAEWFADLQIVRGRNDPEYLPLKRLLSAACLATRERPFGDIDRLPPAIAGDVMRSILSCGELPTTLLNAVIQRCRAEQAKKDDKTGKPVRHVSYPRASLMKAHLNRHFRIHAASRKEITVSLDQSNTDKPYLLGRLFATFERMQEVAADRELNRTIRDSFFGAAMATPRSVFPRLIRLNQQHLRDMKRGRSKSTAAYFDRVLRDINEGLDPVSAFPAVFDLKDQGVFAIGYYHQRQDFYPKKDATDDLPIPKESESVAKETNHESSESI